MPARKPAKPRKTAAKTAGPKLVPQPHGGALLTGGVPGNKGGGRLPDEHLEWCRRVVSDPTAEKEVEAVLKDNTHPAFAAMWKVMAERGYGKPAQPVVGDPARPVELRVRFVNE